MSRWSRAAVAAGVAVLVSAFVAACGGGGAAGPGGPGGAPGAPPVSVAPAVQRQVQDSEEFSARLEATDTVEVRAHRRHAGSGALPRR